jgi:hypothetical protein
MLAQKMASNGRSTQALPMAKAAPAHPARTVGALDQSASGRTTARWKKRQRATRLPRPTGEIGSKQRDVLASATGNFQRPALRRQNRLQLRQDGWAIAFGSRAVSE